MSFFGGGRSSQPSPPASQTTFVREAPGIEERKIELMDIARQVAQQPINLPAVQAAPAGALEQLGFTQAGQLGVGAPTVQQGIAQIQAAAAPVGQAQINQFLNPFQSAVTDEIARQGQIMQNRLSAQAVGQGAFGGGREGVQQAELQSRILAEQARANQAGFSQALGAAQRQQALGLSAGQQLGNLGAGQQQMAQRDIQTLMGAGGVQRQQALGLSAGQQLGNLGAGQQQMAQRDIQTLMGAGGVQRQLAQQALDAQRATTLQQQFEPFQRAEFLSNLYAAGPKSQSSVTMGTQPTTSPLAQAVGTGIGAFAAFGGTKD
jgi:hypothetical protein